MKFILRLLTAIIFVKKKEQPQQPLRQRSAQELFYIEAQERFMKYIFELDRAQETIMDLQETDPESDKIPEMTSYLHSLMNEATVYKKLVYPLATNAQCN